MHPKRRKARSLLGPLQTPERIHARTKAAPYHLTHQRSFSDINVRVIEDSQAGPHKVRTASDKVSLRTYANLIQCERINPSTGKPCNTIFSRPYDLTQHEDTIHNARKQKASCPLCIEEKTFTRNDAFARHLRVVHPDHIDPSKSRRRNGHR
jgi:hypothetical protein